MWQLLSFSFSHAFTPRTKKLGFSECSILFQALQKCEEFLWSIPIILTTGSFKELNFFFFLVTK